MSDICEHETFRDICGVCHRNTIIEKQETEITALRAVNDALSEQMMTMIDNAGKVAALRAEVERLTKALDVWACACRVDVTMEGVVFRGIERSAAARAWKATLDALKETSDDR